MNCSRRKPWLAGLLILLLVFQMNALPIHEYNLRQAGYTLVHVQPGEVARGTGPATIFPRNHDFYNIALCETHFLLTILQQFEQLFAGLLLLSGLRLAIDAVNVESSLFRHDYFLCVLSSRAPPVVIK
jgi:hypothetical protein